MAAKPRITLVEEVQSTQYAPLAALGYYLREQDLFSPIYSRLVFRGPTHTSRPVFALLDVWVSILAGCRSVSQINTRLRPDRVLARAWGRPAFFEQSTLARVLDACQAEQVSQLCSGVEQIYRWIGRAPRQLLPLDPGLLDIDLTGLPAGRGAQGSTKGYFGREKGGAGDSSAGLGPHPLTKSWLLCSIPATPSASRCSKPRCFVSNRSCPSLPGSAPGCACVWMPALVRTKT